MPSDSGLRLLAVHAHADDETITMGGVLAVCSDRGITTAVTCCTDGSLATIVAADMPEESTRPHLAEIRQGELRAACAILGVDDLQFLGYGDSGMQGTETNDRPGAFWATPLSGVIERLVERIRSFRPHVVVTYDGIGAYGHPDHIQTHRATLLAVEAAPHKNLLPAAGPPWMVSKLYYTAFPRRALRRAIETARARGEPSPFGDADPDQLEFGTPDELVTTEVDCRSGWLRKRDALLAHHSQITPDWPMIKYAEVEGWQEFAKEYFQLAISHVAVTLPESDLFEGLGG